MAPIARRSSGLRSRPSRSPRDFALATSSASDLEQWSVSSEEPARPGRAELLAGDDEFEVVEPSEGHERAVAELVVCSHEDAPCRALDRRRLDSGYGLVGRCHPVLERHTVGAD